MGRMLRRIRCSDALRHDGCDTLIVFRALLLVLAASASFAVWYAATASLSRYFVRQHVARSEPLPIRRSGSASGSANSSFSLLDMSAGSSSSFSVFSPDISASARTSIPGRLLLLEPCRSS